MQWPLAGYSADIQRGRQTRIEQSGPLPASQFSRWPQCQCEVGLEQELFSSWRRSWPLHLPDCLFSVREVKLTVHVCACVYMYACVYMRVFVCPSPITTHYKTWLSISVYFTSWHWDFFTLHTHPHNTHHDRLLCNSGLGTRKHVRDVLRRKLFFLKQRRRGRSKRKQERVRDWDFDF